MEPLENDSLLVKELSREFLQRLIGDDYVISEEDTSIVTGFFDSDPNATINETVLTSLARQMISYSKPEMKKKFLSAYFGGSSSSGYEDIIARNRKHACADLRRKIAYLPKPYIDDVITPYVDGLAMWKDFSISRIDDLDWTDAVWENQDASSVLYVLARMRTLSTGKNLNISLANTPEAIREARIRLLLILPSLQDKEVKYLKPEYKKLYFGSKKEPNALAALVNYKRRTNDALRPMVESIARILSHRGLVAPSLFMTGYDSLQKEYRPLLRKRGGKKVMVNSIINPFALNGIRYLQPSEKLPLDALKRNSDWENLNKVYSAKPRTEIEDAEFDAYQKAYTEQCKVWFGIRRAARVRFDRMQTALKQSGSPLSQADAEATIVEALAKSGIKTDLQDYLSSSFRAEYQLGAEYNPLLGKLERADLEEAEAGSG